MELTPIAVIGIIAYAIVKIMQLLVGRRERLKLIEKLEPGQLPQIIGANCTGMPLFTNPVSNGSPALRWGSCAVGLGLGLLVFALMLTYMPTNMNYDIKRALGGGTVLFFGGIGLLVGYFIELRIARKNRA